MVKMIQDPVKSKMADGVQSWKWLNVTQHLKTPVAFEARAPRLINLKRALEGPVIGLCLPLI